MVVHAQNASSARTAVKCPVRLVALAVSTIAQSPIVTTLLREIWVGKSRVDGCSRFLRRRVGLLVFGHTAGVRKHEDCIIDKHIEVSEVENY